MIYNTFNQITISRYLITVFIQSLIVRNNKNFKLCFLFFNFNSSKWFQTQLSPVAQLLEMFFPLFFWLFFLISSKLFPFFMYWWRWLLVFTGFLVSVNSEGKCLFLYSSGKLAREEPVYLP